MSHYQNGAHSRGTFSSQRSARQDQSLSNIKERVDQISASMKQSQSLLKSKYGSLPQTPENHAQKYPARNPNNLSSSSMRFNHEESEIRARTPPKKHSPDRWTKTKADDPLSEFLNDLGLEELLPIFDANQVSYEDLQYLTKEDLNDMNVPIGPRNRLFNAISSIQNNPQAYEQMPSNHTSPKRLQLKEEVDQFMNELTQLSKRNESRNRPSSRQQSIDSASFESAQSQRSYESLKAMLMDISEKQEFMMKAIKENQKAIAILEKKQNEKISLSMSRGRSSKSPGKASVKYA
ncbi:unnamed protein product [Blepharisma stoltei]|uniref:SAM domain-containing protein n=1 Tax=Blepharisma stoltei TaxID=1481888 RepID=A0AAU9J2D5_9CILI|nr:unnamed protein product [Blepharisma stoltei]